MKIPILFPVIFLLVFIPGLSAQITQSQVENAESIRYTTMISADTTALSQMLADEFIYHQPTGVVVSKSEYLINISSGNTQFRSANFTKLDVSLYGHVAVSRGSVEVELEVNGKVITTGLRFLNIWVYRYGHLQLAARQSAFLD
ncbi:MAG: nuclear transport factor 2 family protein [Balneolaceae bacterium]|nr:MAG: nuclear transport factor 2 family protein [Balneolaceae bacterium]